MVNVYNAYFNFSGSYNLENFEKDVEKVYNENEMIRMVIDLENRDISMSSLSDFKKLKNIFDDDNLGVEKLLETIVICKDGIKKRLIQGFIKLIPTKRPVKIY